MSETEKKIKMLAFAIAKKPLDKRTALIEELLEKLVIHEKQPLTEMKYVV